MASDETPGRSKPTVSVVVPTYQESTNIPILFDRIKHALNAEPWELIVVDDDSPDGTSSVAFALAPGWGNLASGTRLRDGDLGGSLSPARQALSDMGTWFFRRIAGAAVADPMSGFFMIRREIVSRLAPRLSPDGFKILVDVILSAGGGLKIVEVPYVFRKRNSGESKLTPLVGMDFLGLVVHHASGGLLPI